MSDDVRVDVANGTVGGERDDCRCKFLARTKESPGFAHNGPEQLFVAHFPEIFVFLFFMFIDKKLNFRDPENWKKNKNTRKK